MTSMRAMAANITWANHYGGHWLDELREREEWCAKVRACGLDVDALLAEAQRMADESIDATITTPRPALTMGQARAIVWSKAIGAIAT